MTTLPTPAPVPVKTLLPGKPCLVLAVGGAGGTWAQKLIRIGQILAGKPGLANHVAIVTHLDKLGRWIGVQGQPGGVSLVDCTAYLNSPYTSSNYAQPGLGNKQQQGLFLASCAKSLGISYDWVGIAEDALAALHAEDLSKMIDPLWRWPAPGGQLPGHLVCSSLAAMLYERVNWPHPGLGTERQCEPGDWEKWNTEHGWEKP